MKEENQTKKENKVGFIVLIISIAICFISVSYAVWTKVFEGQKENQINTATLILTLDESDSNAVSLTNAMPVSDTKGLTYEPFTFRIKNSGTIDANYRVMIVNDTETYNSHGCDESKLDWSNIKYSFSKNDDVATTGLLSDTSGVLTIGNIAANDTESYQLKLWIKSDATNEIMNQHFHGVIKVEAIQGDQTLTN